MLFFSFQTIFLVLDLKLTFEKLFKLTHISLTENRGNNALADFERFCELQIGKYISRINKLRPCFFRVCISLCLSFTLDVCVRMCAFLGVFSCFCSCSSVHNSVDFVRCMLSDKYIYTQCDAPAEKKCRLSKRRLDKELRAYIIAALWVYSSARCRKETKNRLKQWKYILKKSLRYQNPNENDGAKRDNQRERARKSSAFVTLVRFGLVFVVFFSLNARERTSDKHAKLLGTICSRVAPGDRSDNR